MKTISLLAATALSISVLAPSAVSAAPVRSSSAPTTQVTLKVDSCDGCTITLASYLQGSMDAWESTPKKVSDGSVTFRVPTDRTTGLSVEVRAPWEGATGYVTNAVFRYQGAQPGDKVGFTRARAATKASGCWAGTTDDAVTLKLKVREVQVDGLGGKVPGSIAWFAVTQDWLRPLVEAWGGVVGTQDVMPCKA
jgi:hypothetical protein